MAALTKVEEKDLLIRVKKILGITGTYNDEAINMLIMDIKYELIDSGVNEIAVNSETAIGVITRGVADLWNLGSGTVNLSNYYKERAAKLALIYPSRIGLIHERTKNV